MTQCFQWRKKSGPARVRCLGVPLGPSDLRALIRAVALALAIGAALLRAQSNAEGGLFGRVIGASAGELAGATAAIASVDTLHERVARVSASGTFESSNLPPGKYEVTLRLAGRVPLRQTVEAGLGLTTLRFDLEDPAVKLSTFVVTGEKLSLVDVAGAEIGLGLTADTVKQLPVARDLTSVALLAPGVVAGETGYYAGDGSPASFGGASQAENSYYLNGFNLTDFRRGLGFGTVPFEFFQEFQIATAGSSAEFGRATGGVVNAISKRGSNQYHAAVSIYWEPASLRENVPDSFRANGTLYLANSVGNAPSTGFGGGEDRTANLEFSGPIVKNRLFFHGLYQQRDHRSEFISGTNQYNFRSDRDPFVAAKVDWRMLPGHALEYTAFRDARTIVDRRFSYPLTAANFVLTRPAGLGANLGNNYSDRGGRAQIGRYAGRFGDDFALSALFGKSTKNASNRSEASSQPYILNQSTSQVLSGVASVTNDQDTRKAYRVDGRYDFTLRGIAHKLRFGYDREDNKAHSVNQYSGGGVAYVYQNYTGGTLANNATPPAGTTQIAQVLNFRVGGDFRVITGAFYAEDSIRLLSDRLTATAGLRSENFDNRNGQDKTFIKMSDQYAPRFSVAYDVNGDGLAKVHGSAGRSLLQIPAMANILMAGAETYYWDYFVLNSIGPNGAANLGPQVGNRVVIANGTVPDVASIVNSNIAPMAQDEFSIGFERTLGKLWKCGVTAIYRDLQQVVEDAAIDAALLKYAKARGDTRFAARGSDYYVLTNPGKPVTVAINLDEDANKDGVVNKQDQGADVTKEKVTLTEADLGLPPAVRKYFSVALALNRVSDGKWFGQGSYVWSHSYGNYEGTVYSEIGQREGITSLFDQPGLTDGTFGDLPNDRRHVFKVNGGYHLTKQFLVSGNASVQSGRPISGLGLHPSDAFARANGALSRYVGGVLFPRGAGGRAPWVKTLDFAAKYTPAWGREKVVFGVDAFNVFNFQGITGVYERAELSSGATDTRYRRARTFQTPRYIRFGVAYTY